MNVDAVGLFDIHEKNCNFVQKEKKIIISKGRCFLMKCISQTLEANYTIDATQSRHHYSISVCVPSSTNRIWNCEMLNHKTCTILIEAGFIAKEAYR